MFMVTVVIMAMIVAVVGMGLGRFRTIRGKLLDVRLHKFI